MKRASLILLVLTACSSGGGLQSEVRQLGEPGAAIMVDISRAYGRFSNMEGPVEMMLEIENMADYDVTVDRVQIENDRESSPYVIQSKTRTLNELISEGESIDVDMGTWGRQTRKLRYDEESRIILRVSIVLTNGDKYAGSYIVPVQVVGGF